MPLFIPPDQSFEAIPWLGTPGGGATHPTFATQYLPFYPFGHLASGTSPTNARVGYLSTHSPGLLTGASCSHSLTGGVSDTSMRCFASVWTPSVDCIARVSLIRRTTNSSTGAQVLGGFRGGAVFSRIGGTYGTTEGVATGVTVENAEYADCYALWMHPLSTAPNADLWFHVFGITHSSAVGSSGTLRELAVHKITGGMALVDSSAAFDASLEITTNGADVDIRARVHVITGGGSKIAATLFSTGVLGGTVTLGTDVTATSGGLLTDAHVDKITTGNGVGWGMYATRTDTVSSVAVDITEGINMFRVTNASTNKTIYEDDFSRVAQGELDDNLSSLFRIVTDGLGDTGKWLNSGWAYGATANTSNTADDVDPLLGQTEAGTTSFDGLDYLTVQTSQTTPSTAQPLDREFFSTRPADYDYSQHRSLEFKPFAHNVSEPNWSVALDRYGIFLKATVLTGYVERAFVAYLEPIFGESGGLLVQTSLTVRLAVRVDLLINGSPLYLTLWSKTVAGVDLTDGNWHKLQYDMHVVESASDTNAPVVHEVKLNGSTIVFDTPGTYSAGTHVLSDGRVIDSGNFGPGSKSFIEGFFVQSSLAVTDVSGNVLRGPAQVRNWTQETLTLLETTTPPDQMAAYGWAPSDEVNLAKSGDLSTVAEPVFPVDIRLVSSSPVKHEGEQGHHYHRNRATRDRYIFRFRTNPMSEAERAALLAFWSARGVVTSFDFPLTWDRSFVCTFIDKPRFTFVGPDGWTAQLSLMEVLP